MARREETVIEVDRTEEFIETVAPSDAPREQVIKMGNFERTYVQTRLSFIPKLEFIKETSKTLKEVMDDGFSIGDVMGVGNISVERVNEINSTDVVVKGIFRLAELAPGYMTRLFAMALNVPRHEYQIFEEILNSPHDYETGEGGLTDDDAEEILATFIVQNAKAIADFFAQRLVRIGRLLQETINPDLIQDSLRQSKPTRQNTPKR